MESAKKPTSPGLISYLVRLALPNSQLASRLLFGSSQYALKVGNFFEATGSQSSKVGAIDRGRKVGVKVKGAHVARPRTAA